jgi:hypothetical protein
MPISIKPFGDFIGNFLNIFWGYDYGILAYPCFWLE